MELEPAIKQFAVIKFTEIFIESIMRYAKPHNGTQENVFLILRLDDNGELCYHVAKEVEPGKSPKIVETIDILKILNRKILMFSDRRGFDQMGPPVITDAIIKLAAGVEMAPSEIAIMFCTNTVDLYLLLYHWTPDESTGIWQLGRLIKQIESMEELF